MVKSNGSRSGTVGANNLWMKSAVSCTEQHPVFDHRKLKVLEVNCLLQRLFSEMSVLKKV